MESYCKILIVEDEFLLRQGIKNLVHWEQEGFQVVGETNNGKEALQLIESLHPHLVITDIVMPIMDGIELTGIIQERYPEIKVVVLSSYSDFEYIKSAMKNGAEDYLLKPTMNPDSLLKAVQSAASKLNLAAFQKQQTIPEQMVQKWISGFAADISETDWRKAFPYDTFLLLGTDLIAINKTGETLQRQEKWLQTAIPNEFKQSMAWAVTTVDRKCILILLNISGNDLQSVLQTCNGFFEKLRNHFPDSFYAAPPAFQNPLLLKRIYQQDWRTALNQHFYDPEACFFYAAALPDAKDMKRFETERFSVCLKSLRLQQAVVLLIAYMQEVMTAQIQPEYEVKSMLLNSIYQIMAVLEDLKLNAESINYLKQHYFMQINHIPSAKELLEFLQIMEADMAEIEAKYHISPESLTIRSILDYIAQHYDEPLTLRQLSEQFNFNYYYLSKYFSSHCKEGFNEYLNRIRVEKASEMLLKEKMPISEICGAVGYMDHSYFTKVFKKFTGYTPKQFRNQKK